MASGAVIARILSQYSDKGSAAARKDIKKLGGDFDKFAKHAKMAFGVAAAASAAFAIKVGVDSVKAAMDDQKSQALLAKSLQNTTHASAATVAGVEKYIDRLELATGVSDNLLRPSLAALARVTGSVTKAQYLQGIAMDTSAGTGKDLETVSLAISKAVNGNFGALTRLGVPLDKAALKSKDLNKILKTLSNTFAGQAAVLANTFTGRLARMGVALEQMKEKIGFALLPVIQGFVDKISNEVLPKIQAWIELNQGKLAQGLQNAANFVYALTRRAIALGEWIANHKKMIEEFAVILASLWVAGRVLAFATAIGRIATAFKAVATASKAAAFWEALATGGASLAAGLAAVAVLGLGTAWVTAGKQAVVSGNKMAGAGRGGVALINAKLAELSNSAIGKANFGHQVAYGLAKKRLDVIKQISAVEFNTSKEVTKKTLGEIARQKEIAMLKKFGVTPTDPAMYDAIEYEAARQNLVKQAKILQDAETNAILAKFEAQMKTVAAAQKYSDIIAALADGKLSDAEVINLSVKWGMTTKAVIDYIVAAGFTKFELDKSFTAGPDSVTDAWEKARLKYLAYLAATTGITIPNTGSSGGGGNVIVPRPSYKADGSDRAGGDFGTPYVSPNTNQQGSAYVNSNGSDRAGGVSPIVINVNGSLLDQGGLINAVQGAVQQLTRNGSSLSGNSSRGG